MILVIKLSGKVLEESQPRIELCRQVACLQQEFHRLVLVHGGGKQLSELCQRLDLPVIQHQGRRVTDPVTLDLAIMAFSAVNRNLVSHLVAAGLRALGISAFDAGLTTCRRRPPIPITTTDPSGQLKVEKIDFGLVGEIKGVNPSVVHQFWESDLVAVVSCLGAESDGQILNINADTLAAELAIALGADRLLSVSDVQGIYRDASDPSSRIDRLSASQAKRLLEEGSLQGGMVPKVETALKSLDGGVAAAQILSGLEKGALLTALQGKAGTLLLSD